MNYKQLNNSEIVSDSAVVKSEGRSVSTRKLTAKRLRKAGRNAVPWQISDVEIAASRDHARIVQTMRAPSLPPRVMSKVHSRSSTPSIHPPSIGPRLRNGFFSGDTDNRIRNKQQVGGAP